MALNINTFSPFSMRSSFDDSFFSNRWNNDWMVSSRNLDNQFKEFRSLFNKEEAKVEETMPGWRSGSTPPSTSRRRRRRTAAATSRGALKELHIAQGGGS